MFSSPDTLDQIFGVWVDNGKNLIGDICPADCLSDLNGDGIVDGYELSYVLGAWGTSDSIADLNSDGVVDGLDLTYILGDWGACS